MVSSSGDDAMPRFKPSDYEQDLLLSVALGKQIVEGSIEWAIHELIENTIDISELDAQYKNDLTGAPAYNPRVMLKIVLAGYSRGILSSRRLEQTCKENVVFMALTCGATPDHSTIAGFVAGLGDKAMLIFQQILMICEKEGLLSGTHLSIDGSKMPSNASKEWSGTFQELKDKKRRIEAKIADMVHTHKRNDAGDPGDDDRRSKKRLKKLQDAAQSIDEFLNKNEPRKGFSGKEIKSNMTDPDSAKMSTSHGVLQGYNANAVVDEKHQIIVGAYAFGHGTDHRNLETLLAQTEHTCQHIGLCTSLKDMILSADTSYFSKRNLEACQRYGVDAYIPDPHFRSRDPRLEDNKRFRRKTAIAAKPSRKDSRKFRPSDFTYDEANKKLTCPNGEHLMSNGSTIIRQGYVYHDFVAETGQCAPCPLRSQCLRNDTTLARSVSINKGKHDNKQKKGLCELMKDKIDTIHGRRTYSKRMGIVEPVFATINFHKGMKRFLLRGIKKVNAQWLLFCTIHNITKISTRKWALA